MHCINGAATAALEQLQALAEPEAMLRAAACLVPRLVRAREGAHATVAPAASTHLVTGGTGGLGLLTARWLSHRGAAHALALVSRSGVLARITAGDWGGVHATEVETWVQRCDTAEGTHVGRLVAHVAGAASAMGVWHAAGVLADGVLPGQTAEALARVYAPKAHGAWALHGAFATAVVRTYALFSSGAALLGGTGQANYSAANAYLDTAALGRRLGGALSISLQIPAVSGAGMGASVFDEVQLDRLLLHDRGAVIADATRGWKLQAVIAKSNDDLRQEQFAAQLIAQFARIFEIEGIKAWLRPYDVLSTSPRAGLVEAVR